MKLNANFCLALLITGVSSPAISQQSTAPNLFEPVPVNQISSFHQDLAAVRQDNVFINFDLLGDRAEFGQTNPVVNLNLFEDVNILATFESAEVVYGGGQIFNYSIGDHDFFYASFSVLTGAVSGVVRSESGELYTIGNVGNGQFTVSEINKSLYEECGVNQSHVISTPSPLGGGSGRADGHTSHLMITFTSDCVTAEGGIDGANTLANLAVSEMNRGLSQGDSTFRVNLAHTYEDATYTQSGDQSTDLSNYRYTGGGLDDVFALRDAYGADFCELFIANYGTGVAYVGCTNNPDAMFSVGKNTRVAATYTLAHEIGHNIRLGLLSASSTGLFVVFNTATTTVGFLDPHDVERRTISRALFIKFTYLLDY